MNYLQLAQKLRRKCRVIGSGPTATTGQSEEYQRLLDWINEAWLFIQRKHEDWRFMRASASCITVQGQAAYSPTTDFNLQDFGYWALDIAAGDTFRSYVTSVGPQSEIFLPVIDYDRWRDTYLYGATRYAYSRPVEIALAPDNSLAVGNIPVAGYTLIGDYYRIPSELVDAGDVPDMPEQYHWAIIYKAMMFYGASESAPEVYDDGEAEFKKIMAVLERNELRRFTLGGALA
jgi:hypothetical protein